MKKYILALLLLQASFSVNATTITVEGFGSDTESAKRDAFRTAIENVCGTVVLSDREYFNQDTIKDRIVTHSSCNVEKYTVLEQGAGRIKLKVEVQPNQIAQRLQQNAENKHAVDQSNILAQTQTFNIEKLTGDELIKEIFIDYPNSAYNLKTKSDISVDAWNRDKIILNIDYEVTWKYTFLKSMIEAIDKIKTKKLGMFDERHNMPPGRITIHSQKPNAWILYDHDTFYLNDLYRMDAIKKYFQNGLLLRIQVRGEKGNNLIDTCTVFYEGTRDLFDANTGYYYDADGSFNQLEIFGNVDKKGGVWLSLPVPPDEIIDVTIGIVTKNNCINYLNNIKG